MPASLASRDFGSSAPPARAAPSAPSGARITDPVDGGSSESRSPSPNPLPAAPAERRRWLIAAVALTGALALTAAWAWGRYALPELAAGAPPTVRLYAGTEEIATFQGTSRRSQVRLPLWQIPRHVVDAVLAAEDRRFSQHRGIDLRAVLRAATTNLRHGEARQGGSTITQQLARSHFLTPERTWWRKLRESAIAVLLEVRYPKDRILEAYLNTVYMGHDGDVAVHGLGAAARHFLGKDLVAVRLDEGALLAAAIAAPNKVFFGDGARAQARRDSILRAMRQQQMLGEADARAAMVRPVQRRGRRMPVRAPYFVDLAREEVARRAALRPSGEVRIATTLDPALQRAAENAIREGIGRIEQRRPDLAPGKLQAALVAIEPASGHILALVGGRGYAESPFNRATRAARQPGSLFKPIVYLAGFEAERVNAFPRFTPASPVRDEPIVIGTGRGTWSPQNMDGRFRGPVTVRQALEQSLNVPAVRVAQDVGLDQVIAVARALGLRSALAEVPSLALGTSEVTLLEITAAFATLANGGVRAVPTTLTVEGDGAGAPQIAPTPPPTPAVSPESAFLITYLLRGVLRDGTGRASARWGLSDVAAGKTGSTEGLRDAWFVGYTPELAVGVWVGMDDATPLGLTGAQAALPVWATVMQGALRRVPPRPFTPPPGVVMATVERDTGRRASFWCGGGARIEEAFRAGSEPPASCGEFPLAGPAEAVLGWVRRVFR